MEGRVQFSGHLSAGRECAGVRRRGGINASSIGTDEDVLLSRSGSKLLLASWRDESCIAFFILSAAHPERMRLSFRQVPALGLGGRFARTSCSEFVHAHARAHTHTHIHTYTHTHTHTHTHTQTHTLHTRLVLSSYRVKGCLLLT